MMNGTTLRNDASPADLALRLQIHRGGVVHVHTSDGRIVSGQVYNVIENDLILFHDARGRDRFSLVHFGDIGRVDFEEPPAARFA